MDYREIYSKHAHLYEKLVLREDHEGNILHALERIRPLAGLEVLELGAGTGRLTCMLAPVVRSICAFDASQHMLNVATGKLEASGLRNWRLQVADHRSLPLSDCTVDMAISGWSIVYLTVEHPTPLLPRPGGMGCLRDGVPNCWQAELEAALGEMKRALRPDGIIILLETLGTGYEKPHPPEEMAEYLAYLDGHGFVSAWIRTDYRFQSLAEAEALTRFFFGDSLADKVVENNWITLPECTGIWWQRTKAVRSWEKPGDNRMLSTPMLGRPALVGRHGAPLSAVVNNPRPETPANSTRSVGSLGKRHGRRGRLRG